MMTLKQYTIFEFCQQKNRIVEVQKSGDQVVEISISHEQSLRETTKN